MRKVSRLVAFVLLIPSARRKTQWNLYLTRRNEICTPLNRPDFSPNLSGKRGKAFRFTNAWEQRKFGEMANRRSEVSASGNLPRVEYEDIVSGTGTLNKDVFEKQSQKQGIVFHSGDVLYGKLRPYLQNWLLASFNGLAVGDFWVLEPQGLNSNYLYRIIQTKQFDEIANQSVGTKMPRADWKLVSKATFLNPASFNEQRLIGKFFKDIDSLLTLHQRQQNGGYLWLENSAKQVCFAIITASGYRSTKKALSDQLR